jgi:hypothetical protein
VGLKGVRHDQANASTGFFALPPMEAGGPTLVHARNQPGSMDKLGRPTVTPEQVARRFHSFMTSG